MAASKPGRGGLSQVPVRRTQRPEVAALPLFHTTRDGRINSI